MTKRYASGVRVDDGSLALDLIDSVGSAPATYLGLRHTRVEHSREVRTMDYLTTAPYRVWEGLGSTDAVERAGDRARDMWDHEVVPDPLPPDVCSELDAIVQQAVTGG